MSDGPTPTLFSSYAITGTDAEGLSYSGEVTLTPTGSPDAYSLDFAISSTPESWVGVGAVGSNDEGAFTLAISAFRESSGPQQLMVLWGNIFQGTSMQTLSLSTLRRSDEGVGAGTQSWTANSAGPM